jgi:tRNA (pseudouridine54-N1)-methyltransferase
VRRFVVVGHRAASAPGFSLKDLGGSGGRLDILVRSVPSALLVSHGLRADVELYTVHLGPPEAPKVVRYRSATLRSLHPDERSTAALVERALGTFTTGPVWQESTPGIAVAAIGLAELLDGLSGSQLFVLEEDGEDVASVDVPAEATFVLGDHLGFTEEERALLKSRGARPVSLGPVSLQADQCLVVLHNHLDRRGR